MRYLIFSIIFIVFGIGTIAQTPDEILFLNGKVIKGSLLEKTKYEFTFKTEKQKEFVIDKFRVFSYTQNNKETIVYEYDTLEGNFLKVDTMKFFVYGERDAQYTYKPVISNTIGLVVGGTAGYFMHKDDAFIYITAPLVYTVGTLIFPTKVHQNKLKYIKYIKEDEYLRGYERIARSKRTQGALKSSIVGVGAGFLISLLVN